MSSRSPVFLVPGLSGTQLRDCTSGQLLWVNPQLMLDCPSSLMEYLDVCYDSKTRSFKSVRGVAPGGDVGDLKSIKNITEPPLCAGSQFEQFVRYLEAIGGYIEGKDLFGMPYDWRLILDQTYWSSFSAAMKGEIEKHTGGCSNTRSSLLGFSLGCLVLTRFLREQTEEWRKLYVRRVIFVGGPLGGCPKAFISICGMMEELPGYNTPCVRRFVQSCSGAFMCHPKPDAFPGLLIIKNLKNEETREVQSFTIEKLKEAYLHPRFRIKNAHEIYSDFVEHINDQTTNGIADDVELHLVYSSVKDTTVGLDYRKSCQAHKIRESDYYRQRSQKRVVKKYEKYPDIEPCEGGGKWMVGDGMVPYLSLSYWDNKKYPNGVSFAQSVKCFFGKQYEHADMFNRIEVIQYVFELLNVTCLDHKLEPLISADGFGV